MKAPALYSGQPLGVRVHTALRVWTAPLEQVVAMIPRQGRLLEVGCGHGLICNEVALRDPGAHVLGIDLDESKIRAAKATVSGRANIEFRLGVLAEIEETDFNTVALVDMLYLVTKDEWPEFLRTCFRKLKPGGTLVLKEIGTKPRWKFERLKVQEYVSTRLIRITKGESVHFESAQELRARLVGTGFSNVTLQELDAGYASPHILLTATRPAG